MSSKPGPERYSILLAACPFTGHVNPMLRLARALTEAGHRTRLLTGSRFRAQVEATGAEFLALPAAADIDERRLGEQFPEREGLRGLAAASYDMTRIFLDPVPYQVHALEAAIAEERPDALVAEPLFLAPLALLSRPRAQRPAVLTLGTMPIALSSRYAPPGGPGLTPLPGPIGRLAHLALGFVLRDIALRGVQRHAARVLRRVGVPRPPVFFAEWPRLSEAIIQLSVPALEFPRPDLAVPVHFVGTLGDRDQGRQPPLPPWWGDLDGGRPIVHVTQGTASNRDFAELLVPTARALVERDVLVVASTGGAPVGDLADRLPASARVAEYLPYDRLLPRVDAMVTNGGYGGVLQALAHGVPLVVAGADQDKADVAARVRWSGTGITTSTRTPSRRWLDRATATALFDPRIRSAAARVRDQLAAAPGAPGAVAVIERFAGEGRQPTSTR